MAISLGDALLKVGVDVSGVDKSLNALNTKMQSMQNGFKKAGKAMTIAGASIVAGMGLAVKSAADFESGMREVNTMMGLGTDEFKSFSESVLQLSKDIGVSAVESTNALYQAISAGVPKENAIEFLTIATKAAIGGVTDTETAVDGLTTVLNAFKMPLSDAQKVADIMFTTVKGGKTTFEELAASMSVVAPMAAAIGVEFEDVMAATATLTKQGTTTAVAMTQIRAAIVALTKPSTDMQVLLDKMGYASGEAALQTLGFAGTMQALRDAADNNNSVLATAFGRVEGLNAMLSLTGDNAETAAADLASMATATDGLGAATEAFNEVNEGTSRQFEKLKEQVMGMAISIGNELIPAIKPLIKGFTDIIAKIMEWAKQNPALFQTIIKVVAVLGGLMAVLGPILMILPGITAALPILGAAFTALMGPIGIIIAAIAALIAIGVLIYKNWDTIKAKAIEIWEAIKKFFTGLWEGIKKVFWAAVDWIKEWGILFLGPVGAIIKYWDKIKEFFSNLWENIKSIFKSAVNWLIGIVEGFVNFWIKGINFLIRGLNKISFDVPDWVPFIGGKKFGVNIPLVSEIKLPRLASGGIITGPTLAMLGEAGPEVVYPLDRVQPGPIITYVIVQIGEEKIADIIDKSLDRRKRIQQVI